MQAQPQSWKRLSSSLAPITVRQGVRRRWAQERGGGYRSAGDPLARSSCDDNSRGNRRGKNRRAHPVFEQAGTGLMLGAGSNDSHRLIKEKTAKYGGLSFDVTVSSLYQPTSLRVGRLGLAARLWAVPAFVPESLATTWQRRLLLD